MTVPQLCMKFAPVCEFSYFTVGNISVRADTGNNSTKSVDCLFYSAGLVKFLYASSYFISLSFGVRFGHLFLFFSLEHLGDDLILRFVIEA